MVSMAWTGQLKPASVGSLRLNVERGNTKGAKSFYHPHCLIHSTSATPKSPAMTNEKYFTSFLVIYKSKKNKQNHIFYFLSRKG